MPTSLIYIHSSWPPRCLPDLPESALHSMQPRAHWHPPLPSSTHLSAGCAKRSASISACFTMCTLDMSDRAAACHRSQTSARRSCSGVSSWSSQYSSSPAEEVGCESWVHRRVAAALGTASNNGFTCSLCNKHWPTPVPVLWPCSSTDRGQVASQQQQQLAFLKFPFAQLLRAQSLIACTCSQHILVGCTPESQPYVLPQVAVVLTAIKQSDSTFVAIPS